MEEISFSENRNTSQYVNGKDTCRVCLTQNKGLESLFSPKSSNDKNISHMFASCTSLNISISDPYPKHICKNCVDDLSKAYAFWQKCRNSIKELNTKLFSNDNDRDTSFTKLKESNVLLDVKECYISVERCKSERDNIVMKENHNSENRSELDIIDEITSHELSCQLGRSNTEQSNSNNNSEIFSNKSIDNKHDRKKYLCTQCGVYVACFQSHSLKHSNFKPHQCSMCGRQYKSKSALNIHKRSHTKETRYTCSQCNSKFITWHSMKSHIKTSHSTERPYICKICSKSFKQSGGLIIHLRIHTGENPYVCSKCNKAFKTSTSLKRHIVIHTGEKKYSCDLCKKCFNRSFNLKQHMITHTGERKHKCEICNKAFTQAHVLRGHIKTHKKVEKVNFIQ